MEEVGALLATTLSPGTVIFLEGDLGAGKTVWARGFVRGAVGDDTLRVTSPTYLLDQTYRTTLSDDDNEQVIE